MASAKAPPSLPKARSDSGQVLSSAGLSTLIGYASAKLVSSVATTVLVVFAAQLAFLKWLELHGVITVNWDALYALLNGQAQRLDLNQDGKLDRQDVLVGLAKAKAFMAGCAPSAAGFAAGFAAGLAF